jgi:hypothetical protein
MNFRKNADTSQELERLDRLHWDYGGGDYVLDVLQQWYFNVMQETS